MSLALDFINMQLYAKVFLLKIYYFISFLFKERQKYVMYATREPAKLVQAGHYRPK